MRCAIVLVTLSMSVLAGGADQAAALLKKGDAKAAADAAKALASKDPANIDAWLVLADAHVALDEPADGWTALESAMEKNPGNAMLTLKLGNVFIKMAEKEQRTTADGTTITNYYLDSERMFDEALKLDPKLADAVFGKAFANLYMNKRDEAKKYVSQCLDMKRDHGKCLALQAYIFYLDRKYPEASRIYEAALKADDSDPLDMLRYGHSFLAQGKKDEAKAAYIACLKRHPDYQTAIQSGILNLAGKDYKKALPMLKEAAAAATNSRHAWYHLGYAHFISEQLSEATDAFNKALKIQPNDGGSIYMLGYTIEKQGDADGALERYRQALKLYPDYAAPAARFESIIVNVKKDIDSAEKLYEELITLAPSYGWGMNNYALILRDWAEARGAARMAKPAPAVEKRIRRSSEVYELAAAVLDKEAQVQSDCGLMFEYYPCIRDDAKAEKYFGEALNLSEWTYRDAFSGIVRLCNRSKNWELLKDHAEGVIGALEGRGMQAVAPVGGEAPRELPNETPGMLARAKQALATAEKNLG